MATMAPRRLSDSEKQDLVGRYKAGESTAALAAAFGCSPNTVSRTVKSLLPPEAYAALKASRQKHGTTAAAPVEEAQVVEPSVEASAPPEPTPTAPPVSPAVAEAPSVEEASDSEADAEEAGTLALDDAEDFAEDDDDTEDDDDSSAADVFTELVPLAGVADMGGHSAVAVKPFAPDLLPTSAYMLVDKVVELDARPLRDFPDIGALDDAELELQGICLFASPRAAKRQCGRSQRVIKVPDTGVFGLTSNYLLARGITRLVMDGSVMALDQPVKG